MTMSQARHWWYTSPHFRGATWKISSFLCFSAINGIVRFLSENAKAVGHAPLPSYEVAFFQNLFGLVFLLPWLISHGPRSLKSDFWALHGLRILLSAVGVVLWYTSLTQMPMAEAVALMFLGPLITTLGAWIFLKEVIGAPRGLAILLGFVGGAIITHTSFSLEPFSFWTLLPIAAAACFSGATLLVRKLSQHDSPQMIVSTLLIFMAPALLIPTLMGGHMPLVSEWGWLVAMGGFAAGAHLCLCKAYASAEVSYLIPYGFTKWFASALIGLVAFAEIPSLFTTVGAFTLMTAIVMLSIFEARKRSPKASQ